MYKKKQCLLCGKDFLPNVNVQKICNNCKTKRCLVCGKTFIAEGTLQRIINAKYCSRDCWRRRKPQRRCKYCNKQIKNRGNKFFCSKKCAGKWREKYYHPSPETIEKIRQAKIPTRFKSGAKHPYWKGGISKGRDLIEAKTEYQRWKQKIKKRDAYTCKICGSRKNLEVHHIFPLSIFPEYQIETWNGITLCEKCHRKIRHKEIQYKNQFIKNIFKMSKKRISPHQNQLSLLTKNV